LCVYLAGLKDAQTVCLLWCFQKWLVIELVDWFKKISFSNAGRYYLIYWRSKHIKKSEEEQLYSLLSRVILISCLQIWTILTFRLLDLDWDTTGYPDTQAFSFEPELYYLLSLSFNCRLQIWLYDPIPPNESLSV
jgi:hypothetical protein